MTYTYSLVSFTGTTTKACIMDWGLGPCMRPENQPAPSPVLILTGKAMENADDVEHLGKMLADSFFNGKSANFLNVIKHVNLRFIADDALRESSKMARLHTMLANISALDLGAALSKGITFVFYMPDLPDVEPDEAEFFMDCCREFAEKRGSTLLHLELETVVDENMEGENMQTLSINFTDVGRMETPHNLVLYRSDGAVKTAAKIYETLHSLVSIKERTHFFKGDFMRPPRNSRSQGYRQMTIEEVCRTDNTEMVKFICLIESKPEWSAEHKCLTMRICDRTASVSVVFRGVHENNPDLPFLLNLQPGSARQLACDVVRSPVEHSSHGAIESVSENSYEVAATKGFFKSARSSITKKFRSLRK